MGKKTVAIDDEQLAPVIADAELPDDDTVVGADEYSEPVFFELPDTGTNDAPVVPDADLVMDERLAALWLANGYMRCERAYRSIRVDPTGLSPRHVKETLRLAVKAVQSGGILYVHHSDAQYIHLFISDETFTAIDAVGDYAAFLSIA